ncbi:MAG: circularly permuted type 2 ATP-grasp protein [Pseudomonadota bacterium]
MVLSGPIAAAERWLSLSPRGGVHHEAVAPDGSLRPHWRGLVGWMEAAGPEGLAAAARELERARAESGIAFSLDPGASTTADPLPVVLSSTDWQAVEAGIIQRARLAEAALADVYGARAQGHGCLLAEGILPPGLLYGTQAFAAHCSGWETPPARYTYVYEADIARTAAGDWVVLADRLDAPLGDGWQIANRIATSQSFAEPFLDLGVRRVASHYARFQELLDSLTGWEGRLALLTGGEQDPRFFSHAYLARYLNAALVEPGDVTVREGAAFVKTLDGLKKIDVMLRGVPDLAVDALHRQRTAAPGAPALSLAVRSGALTLGNAAGSSVLAHRALAPFADAIAARLLDEDLTISDAPCLWLGDPAAQEELRAARLGEGPDAWSIDPLTRRRRKDDPPSPTDRDALDALLEQSAEAHVAQSIPPLAETPVMRDGRVEAAPWMMRVFACWTGEEWSVAPSGVAAEIAPGGPIPALGFGKDVWVLANADDQPSEPSRSLLADRLATGHLRRTGRDLLSRVADEVFWLGRNTERAEATLRLLSVCLRRYLSGNRIDADPELLLRIVSTHATERPDLTPPQAFRDAVRRLVNAAGEPFGLPATLSALRSGAVRARMSISEEGWRYIDRLSSDPRWREGLDLRHSAELLRLIEDAIRNLAAFSGAAQENLTRNYAWRFLEIGRRIERGMEVARVAERLTGEETANEESTLRAWLVISDSSSAYRNRYMMMPRAAAVLDLLVLDEANPRALAFQLTRLEAVLAELPKDGPYRRPEHRSALALLTELRLLDADTMAQTDEDKVRRTLADLMARCRRDLSEISDLLGRGFFAHSEVPVALQHSGRAEGNDQMRPEAG